MFFKKIKDYFINSKLNFRIAIGSNNESSFY